MKLGIPLLDDFLERNTTKSVPVDPAKAEVFAAEMGFWEPEIFDLTNQTSISELVAYLYKMKQSGFIVPYHEGYVKHDDWKLPDFAQLHVDTDKKFDLRAQFVFTRERDSYKFASGRKGLLFEVFPFKEVVLYISIDRDPWLSKIPDGHCHCYVAIGESVRQTPHNKINDIGSIPMSTINKLFDF